jgi:hypothetical protein
MTHPPFAGEAEPSLEPLDGGPQAVPHSELRRTVLMPSGSHTRTMWRGAPQRREPKCWAGRRVSGGTDDLAGRPPMTLA